MPLLTPRATPLGCSGVYHGEAQGLRPQSGLHIRNGAGRSSEHAMPDPSPLGGIEGFSCIISLHSSVLWDRDN